MVLDRVQHFAIGSGRKIHVELCAERFAQLLSANGARRFILGQCSLLHGKPRQEFLLGQWWRTPLIPGVIRQCLGGVVAKTMNEAAHMRTKNIVLGIRPRGRIVGRKVVIGLHECLLRGLPVRRQCLLHMEPNATMTQRKMRKMLGHHVQLFAQRFSIDIKIDKDKTLPGVTPDGLKRMGCFANMWKIPVSWHIFEGAIKVVRPSVERTVKALPGARPLFA